MCSPASDTFNHTFTTFLHLFWILQEKKYWDHMLLNIHLLLFPLCSECRVHGTLCGGYIVRANQNKKKEGHQRERES